MNADSGAGAARREKRKSWPVRVFRLGEEPDDDLSQATSAEARLDMMWPLALEAWSLTGRALPDYPREKIPIRRLPPCPDRKIQDSP
jgi:hypothetical protein